MKGKAIIRRVSLTMLTLLMVFFFGSCSSSDDSAGSYVGTGRGHHGEIKVEVTIASGSIQSIEVLENPENKVLSAPVYEELKEQIIEANSTEVDVVSGASDTSRGFIAAVNDALSRSGAALASRNTGGSNLFKGEAEVETVQRYDVVVIGAGGAGLVAAVTAAEEGASVVVLEKMPAPGGNTLISGGGLNVPGSWMQKRHGIEDSVALYMEDTLKGGDNEGEEILVRTMAENALPAAEWLRDTVGMEFLDRVQQFGGHSVPRAIIPAGNSGEQMISKLLERGEALGVVVKTNTKATDLISDESGAVTGVMAHNGRGQDLEFHANLGVVVAAGGFGSNLEMRLNHNSEYDEEYMSTCLPGTTGDGIRMAEKVDAGMTDMSFIQTYPTCNPKTGIISYVANSRFYGAVLINQEGGRFVNEMGRRDHVSKEILAQTGKTAYLFWDAGVEAKSGMIDLHPEEFEALAEDGLIVKADTIEEAAEYFDIDASTLKAEIVAYNKAVESGVAPSLPRGGAQAAFTEAPFYLQKVVPSVHHTMGGLRIDDRARVLGDNGKVIAGLFAAGETVGGVHGSNRLGGNAITDCVVFGRIAGSSIVSGLEVANR